ncbi:MAG: hypothetical protein IPP27_03555 [Bacteroidetes bacterium]|nr:hypothetical protein [Bacteroidota bacterium]
MPQEVRTIASRYMKNPFELTIGRKTMVSQTLNIIIMLFTNVIVIMH